MVQWYNGQFKFDGATEIAGVENAIQLKKCKGGKYRSRQAIWKAEPI